MGNHIVDANKMIKEMKSKVEEKALLSAYEWGLGDDLDGGRLKTLDRIGQLSRAYTLGRADAGTSSINKEEVLKKIRG